MFVVKVLTTTDCQNEEKKITLLLKQLSDKVVVFAPAISASNVYHIGAYRDGRLVGLIMATKMVGWFGDRLYLDGVVVDIEHRRLGCLQKMMAFAEELAASLGCYNISFTSSRPGAIEAYRKLGFKTTTTAFRKEL